MTHRAPKSGLPLSSFCAAVFSAVLAACGGGGGAADPTPSVAPPAAVALASPVQPDAPANTATLTLRASVAGHGNDAATLRVRYNGLSVGVIEVRAAALTDHRIEIPVVVDGGTLEFVWHDASGAAGRSVTLDRVVLNGKALSALDDDVMFDAGAGPDAFDDMNVVTGHRTLTVSGALRFGLGAGSQGAVAAGAAAAPGFFVDARTGDDSQPGTVDKPWRTLARLQGIRLTPGQGIYLRCGSVWRESLSLSATQLVDGAVVAGYGSECTTRKAVVSGADDFSGGWQKTGNVWSRDLPAGTPKIAQLFIDGQALTTARWPNAADGSGGQAVVAAGAPSHAAAAMQAADVASLAGKDLIGASVQLRTQPWFVEARRVTRSEGGRIEFDTATEWALEPGERYVLQDKPWMLDDAGEFFHDVANQRLHLIAPAHGGVTDLNTALVEGSVRDVALALTQRSKMVVRDVSVRAARMDGLRMTDTPQAVVERVDARNNLLAGVRLWQWARIDSAAPGPSVTNSLVAGNGQYGIDAEHVNSARIQGNRVLATGTATHHTAGVFAAIATGPGAVVEGNVADGSGYNGIRFSAKGGSLVKGNTVVGPCTRLIDCAGIYTFVGPANIQPGHTSTVVENKVSGSPHVSNDTSAPIAGIYIDDHADGVTAADNMVFDLPIGVFVHNASRTSVRNNRLWFVSRAGLWASMDRTNGDWMRLNVFEGNQIVPVVHAKAVNGALPKFNAAYPIWFWHVTDGTAALAAERNVFRDNAVVELQGPLAVHAWLSGAGTGDLAGTARWLQLNPADRPPARPTRFNPLTTTLGPEQVVDSGLDMGLVLWRSWSAPGSTQFAAAATASRAGCVGGCVNFTSGNVSDLLASTPFLLKQDVPYQYSVTLTTQAVGGAILGAPYISREVTPWDDMADKQGHQSYLSMHAAAGAPFEHQTFFMPKAAANARVNLQLQTPGVDVGVDRVSVREVLGYQTAQLHDWARVVHAPASTAGPTLFGCAELGWPAGCRVIGLDGAELSLPVVMNPGTARVLLRADSPFRH